MEFRVLGPLEVWANGVAVPLGTRKQQIVLALLAVNANRLVSLDELVDELWPEKPPPSAIANVRGYVGGLRRVCGPTESGNARILRRGTGYLLCAEPPELDMLTFLAESTAGRAALRAGNLNRAAIQLEAARARWDGPVVCGISRGAVLGPRCTALEDERLAVTDELAELHLALDEPGRAIALLREHVHAYPLRERSHALLLRALYRSGDVAAALVAYADARAVLVDQLGIEPGRELRELHRAILGRQDDLGPSRSSVSLSAARAIASPRPRELPPNIAYFVGRAEETARARSSIQPKPRTQRHRAAVVVFYGPGGSGKSALAVSVAHEIADQFPDGQLYVDLQGATPGLRPLTTVEVLHRLLRSLGVPGGDIPHDAPGAASRFRSMTAEQRLLIVLDNAYDADQMAAFLPASDRSAVLVTSRRPLGVLEADRRIRLGGLPPADGRALLVRLAENAATDQVNAVRIVDLCDHLPLALRIVAGRLSSPPAVSLHDFAERLADRRRRLDELELDGLAVRSSIGVGYEALAQSANRIPRLAARVFRLLGLFNVPDFQPELVAAMLGSHDISSARAALDHLVSAGLLEPLPAERYRLHDLVRLVAAERATAEEDAHACVDALHRGMAYYAGALCRADRLLQPGRIAAVAELCLPPGVMLPDFTEPEPAKIWIDAELRSLVSAMEQAIGLPDGARGIALHIGEPLWEYLYRRHDWNTARRLGELALRAAEQGGDDAMAAWAHIAVGRSAADFCEWDAATRHFDCGRSLYSGMESHYGVVLGLNSLGVAAEFRGDAESALRYLTDCLALVKRHNMRGAEGAVLLNLSSAYGSLGQWGDAFRVAERSLAIRRDLGNPAAVSSALRALASVHCLGGDLMEAERCAAEAIELILPEGDQVREHFSMLTRCEVNLRKGSHAEAMADADAVLVLARQRNDRYAEALALHQKARISAARGDRRNSAEMRDEAGIVRATVRTRRDPFLEMLLQPTDAADVVTGAEE